MTSFPASNKDSEGVGDFLKRSICWLRGTVPLAQDYFGKILKAIEARRNLA